MAEWCDTFLASYHKRPTTVRQVRKNLVRVVDEFGHMPLSTIRPMHVDAWIAKMQAEGLEASTVYVIYAALRQVCNAAVRNEVIYKNPCAGADTPPMGQRKDYCLTEEQVWALHDTVPDHLRVAILLGAFAGLRIGEAVGLKVEHVDLMRLIVHPKQQYDGQPLKTMFCDAPIPIHEDTGLALAYSLQKYPSAWMVSAEGEAAPGPAAYRGGDRRVNLAGRISGAILAAREPLGLPAKTTFHDLRHF